VPKISKWLLNDITEQVSHKKEDVIIGDIGKLFLPVINRVDFVVMPYESICLICDPVLMQPHKPV
jgi:hypothetical protein